MSLKENDIAMEGMHDELIALGGIWFAGESLEEALTKERWCKTHGFSGQRKVTAILMDFEENKQGRWVRKTRTLCYQKDGLCEEDHCRCNDDVIDTCTEFGVVSAKEVGLAKFDEVPH